MSQEITTTAVQQPAAQLEIEKQKFDAWGKMGVIIYRRELEFQVQAQAALSKIEVHPASINDISTAEATLKEVKADQTRLIEERKKITARFDDVATRLMAAEKSFLEPIAKYAETIIRLKKALQDQQAKAALKTAELKRIREQIIGARNALESQHRLNILNTVNAAYAHALNKGDIKPEGLITYMKVVNEKCGTLDRYPCTPPEINPQFATAAEIDAIIMDAWNITSAKFRAIFEEELFNKFTDYDAAYANKTAALALSEKEATEARGAIAANEQMQTAAAKLESHATDVQVGPSGVTALRRGYEVAMDDTFENAMLIMSAFVANQDKCRAKTTTKKWFAFNADSAAKALAKVKSDDNSFAPAGILFKEIDKL